MSTSGTTRSATVDGRPAGSTGPVEAPARTVVVRRVHGHPKLESLTLEGAERLFEENLRVLHVLEGGRQVYSYRELLWLAESDEYRDKSVLEISVVRLMCGG